MKIMFVCTGNTCRSPMAQALMEKKCREKKLNILCRSCGLGAFSGEPASDGAVLAMESYGIDLSIHRSAGISAYMFDEYDLFVCMTPGHAVSLAPYVPRERLLVLGGGIPDPYGGSEEVYRQCAAALDRALDALVQKLSGVLVLPMGKPDIADIAEMEKACFSQPWSADALTAELDNASAVFYVAKKAGITAGYIGMHIAADECYIANLAVKEDCRRQGIAQKLLEKAESSAQDKGCAFISLEVRLSNLPAQSLYEKRGYQKVGERKNFYSAPTENALIMTKIFENEKGTGEDQPGEE
ncbi:MAG: ribosomal protein S18-alanine N-acetyltransferase [Oscillospiraceae bacterium]|nr:ribosomal protein S18-alanine N-acetyltransferase [Oscillospiraceae bacterium]